MAPSQKSAWWERKVLDTLTTVGEKSRYVLLTSKQLVGILLCIFVKPRYFPFIHDIQFDKVATGVLGIAGNKGGVAIRFHIWDTSFCFINSHLTAHTKNVKHRNENFHSICRRVRLHNYKNKFQQAAHIQRLAEVDGQRYMFWMGDLNYRLTCTDVPEIRSRIDGNDREFLLQHDQLIQEIGKEIGRAVQQECRDRSRMPSSA
eukprot:TRINITY_DN33566_c0_g1_i2.p1 TRINITY_DN33566_c0_g1~~TRINITY_DN33566_c0_g1_i2.p1  ORF type:complete len:203 (-),score=21.46 TRINITY_DN33566_c0_g1_i2:11-619(-)